MTLSKNPTSQIVEGETRDRPGRGERSSRRDLYFQWIGIGLVLLGILHFWHHAHHFAHIHAAEMMSPPATGGESPPTK